ncbi:MAG TPA: hypothetical protein VMR86_03305 [Myxococcota bacterium]|nr:hypothetical protein [Myxococcota bacterium]
MRHALQALVALGAAVACALAWHTYMAYWGACRVIQRLEGPGGTVEVWASPHYRDFQPLHFMDTSLGNLTDNADVSVLLRRTDDTTCGAVFVVQADLAEDHVPMTAEWSEAEVRVTEPKQRDSLSLSLRGPCKTVFAWHLT